MSLEVTNELVLAGEWQITFADAADGRRSYQCVEVGGKGARLEWTQAIDARLPIRVARGFNGREIDLSSGFRAPCDGAAERDAAGRRCAVRITECHAESIPYWLGLRVGDRVLSVDDVAVRSFVELAQRTKLADEGRAPVHVRLERDGAPIGLLWLTGDR
ncbi:MAG: hypothetical protein L6Q99_12035 [Planctomycetes bacterium]|nr:hypothetical protein [Planctomycetota bacterium]